MASPLLQLPADIRNIIYDFTFSNANGVHIDLQEDRPRARPSDIFALSRTCKALYRETKDLPYWLNEVHLHVPLLQDLRTMRSNSELRSTNTPLVTIQPAPCVYKARRMLHLPGYNGRNYPSGMNSSNSSYLNSTLPDLRQKAQDYITLAMRLPHLEPLLARLGNLTLPSYRHPGNDFLLRMRRLHIHLGVQTENIFLERFFTTWDAVAPILRGIVQSATDCAEVRIEFQLRLSWRLQIGYEFDVRQGREDMLAEMDLAVHRAMWLWRTTGDRASALSLPELASVNAVRERVWRSFAEGKSREPRRGGYQAKSPAQKRRVSMLELTTTDQAHRAATGGCIIVTASA